MNKLIITISFILDIILSNLFPYTRNNLSYFTPLFVPLTIYLIYPHYKSNKKYLRDIFITGILYDLFMTNLLFFNSFIFILLGIITIHIFKNFKTNIKNNVIFSVFIIVVYELIEVIIFILFKVTSANIKEIFYYMIHSILINLIYAEIVFGIKKKSYV